MNVFHKSIKKEMTKFVDFRDIRRVMNVGFIRIHDKIELMILMKKYVLMV